MAEALSHGLLAGTGAFRYFTALAASVLLPRWASHGLADNRRFSGDPSNNSRERAVLMREGQLLKQISFPEV